MGIVGEDVATAGMPGPLEDGLTEALPRLRRHLSARARRVPGLEPEDLVQEVVARALGHRASFDRRRALWPWLRRVAERVVLDQRAARTRAPAAATGAEPCAREAPGGSDPAERCDAREEIAHLLARLPREEREVLVRFHQRGESIRAIAKALDRPEGTVKSHLHRARRRLAESAHPEDPDE